LGNNRIEYVYVGVDNKIYVCTYQAGISISSDGGNTFVTRTTANGLGSNGPNNIFVDSSGKIYVNGLGVNISVDGGNTFINKNTSNGLVTNYVNSIFVSNDGRVFASNGNGLDIANVIIDNKYQVTNAVTGDIFKVIVSPSQDACPSTPTAFVSTTVSPILPSSVSISSSPTGAICQGSNVTFTTTPTNGGTTPTYQWKNNGIAIVGATGTTYTANSLVNNDVITCVMTSNANCVSNTPATSSGITMSVNAPVPVSLSLTSTLTGPICPSSSVTFTALPVNGGTNPTFQWKKNQINISGETSATYITSTLNDSDAISCEMLSNQNCVSDNPAISNILVSSVITEPINILISKNAICPGDSVIFSAEINAGELFWYNQQSGGIAIGQGSNFSFKPTATSSYFVGNETLNCQSNRIAVGTVNVASPFFTATWLGLTTDWTDSDNWSGGFVPNSCTNVIVEVGVVNMPIVTGEDNFCKSINIKTGANIHFNDGAKLSVLN
jgi:hypothetical protein